MLFRFMAEIAVVSASRLETYRFNGARMDDTLYCRQCEGGPAPGLDIFRVDLVTAAAFLENANP